MMNMIFRACLTLRDVSCRRVGSLQSVMRLSLRRLQARLSSLLSFQFTTLQSCHTRLRADVGEAVTEERQQRECLRTDACTHHHLLAVRVAL